MIVIIFNVAVACKSENSCITSVLKDTQMFFLSLDPFAFMVSQMLVFYYFLVLFTVALLLFIKHELSDLRILRRAVAIIRRGRAPRME